MEEKSVLLRVLCFSFLFSLLFFGLFSVLRGFQGAFRPGQSLIAAAICFGFLFIVFLFKGTPF